MKNNLIKISLFVFAMVFLVGLVSAAVYPINVISPYSNEVVPSSTVTYSVSVNVANYSSVEVFLLDENFSILRSNPSTSYSFNELSDGKYHLYVEVTLNNGTIINNDDYIRNFSVSAPISISFVDPTPENNDLLNSNYNDLTIISKTNKISLDNFTIYLLDSNNSIVSSYTDNQSKITDVIDLANISDGNYTFYAELYSNSNSANSSFRNITIKRTLPTLINLTTLGLPSIIVPNQSISFNSSFVPSELLSSLSFKAVFNGTTYSLGGYGSLNNSEQNLNFSLYNLSSLGSYQLIFNIRDNYGNMNSVNFANITVANPTITTGGNGGGGRNGIAVPLVNSTNVTLPVNNTENITPGNQTNTTNPGFFSGITGAVTGALGKRSVQIIIYIIAIVALAYIALLIRRKYFSK